MEKTLLGLTNPQKSIWLTEQFYNGSCVNNICGTVRINEPIEIDLLRQAIQQLIEENDSFRLRFCIDEDGTVKQYLSDSSDFSMEVHVLDSNQDLISLQENSVNKRFELFHKPLYRFDLYQFKDHTGGFVLTIHHLIGDACTSGLIASKFSDIYLSLKNNQPRSKQDTSYLHFISSEQSYLQSEKFQKDQIFWKELFSQETELASIPSSSSSSATTSDACRKRFEISSEKLKQIQDYCSSHQISVFNFFMAIYAIYIGRVSHLEHFVLGTPILNRSTFAEKNTTGMFISTMPFQFDLSQDLSFSDLASKIVKDTMSMFRHQKYPYQMILEEMRKSQPNLPNLYHVLISYQNTRTNRNESDLDYTVEWTFNHNVADSIQIHLFDMNDLGILNVAYDFKTELYTSSDIESLHTRILNMIDQVLLQPDLPIHALEIVTPEEKFKLLETFNQTDLPYDEEKTLIDLFEEQVQKTPDAIALVFEKQTMSYRLLNQKVNSLATYLRSQGIINNSIVGVMLPRSFEMIIALLAVLKAGGAYIPLDPEYPQERISYILENSQSNLILSSKNLQEKLEQLYFSGKIILTDLANESIYTKNKENLTNISTPDDLSYLIYTSGSTGNPKGVMLTQKNFSNFLASMKKKAKFLEDGLPHSIVSITTVSFDIFAFETLVSLCYGLKLYITNDFEQKITLKLERLLLDSDIEILQTTPSIMNFHLENSSLNGFSKLKYIVLAGEQLPLQLVQKIKKIAPNCVVYNGYGPSETTIFSTFTDVTDLEQINIGRPLHNTQIYIVDQNLSLLPPYSLGEICIAGDGVGKGYLYNPNLTDQSFVVNPYRTGSKLYRTGDLGYFLPTGEIICKGRKDHQVKLHGLRIELGEIENCIASFEPSTGLKAAVIVKNIEGKDTLVAFLSSNATFSLQDLKQYLAQKLPNYMIPSCFTLLESLPLTPNGKINRKILQTYAVSPMVVSNPSITPPRNLTEERIIASIKKKLNISEFGIDDNIFDFGADSLSIINILTDLFQYQLDLKVYDLYRYPTVRSLSDHLLNRTEITKEIPTTEYEELNKLVENFPKTTDTRTISTPKTILLTGATGFLGSHILAKLLDTPQQIQKIYCAVRKKENRLPDQRLKDRMHFYFGDSYDDKIQDFVEVIDSDINETDLGIEPSTFSKLLQQVDTVIHCAANVKHYGNYDDFEKTNIVGTRNILKFCQMANSSLHYISTMTISGNYLVKQNLDKIVFHENSFFQNQSFASNVYSKSKLIAESIVLRGIQSGLNATIYRIGDLTGRYSDGFFQQNIQDNAIYTRLKSMLEIGAIPDTILKNLLEFTPVDYAAEAVCKILYATENNHRIFHIYNPNMIQTSVLLEWMKGLGFTMTVKPQDEFIDLVKQLSTNEEHQKKISGIINDFTDDHDFVYNHILETSNLITCDYLKNLGFQWPKLDLSYFKKLIHYMRKTGFLTL